MASTYKLYAGDAVTRNFGVTFPYLDKSHVTVSINGVATLAFSWLNDAMVQLGVAPAAGAVIEIRRYTPTVSPVDFTDGSVLGEAQLDMLATYSAFLAQEALEINETAMRTDATGNLSARSLRIANVADPVNAQDAVTKAWAETAASAQVAQAITARSGAEAARDIAVGAKDTAVSSASTATGARDAAVTAKGLAEGARDTAVTAKDTAVTAKGAAETARDVTIAARDVTTGARDVTVTARDVTTGARDTAVGAKDTAVQKAAEAAASALSVNAANLVDRTSDQTVAGLKRFTSDFSARNFAGRNRIRNPKMEIAQRGTSFPGYTTGTYCLDGWVYSSSSGATVTMSQAADAPAGAEYSQSLRLTVTTADNAVAATDRAAIVQPIEGYFVRDLVGNPIAIQFDVKSPKAGTHCVSLRNGSADRCYVIPYTVTAANTWQKVYLTLPSGLTTAGTWNFTNGVGVYLVFMLMAGANFLTASPNTWVAAVVDAVAGQVNCLDTVGNVFAIGGVQLEKGLLSTSLEYRDMGTEWALNQRYYEKNTIAYQTSNQLGGAALIVSVPHKVTKRATPTTTLLGVTGLNVSTVNIRAVDTENVQLQGINSTASAVLFIEATVVSNAEL